MVLASNERNILYDFSGLKSNYTIKRIPALHHVWDDIAREVTGVEETWIRWSQEGRYGFEVMGINEDGRLRRVWQWSPAVKRKRGCPS